VRSVYPKLEPERVRDVAEKIIKAMRGHYRREAAKAERE
jgi:hypothetical protein